MSNSFESPRREDVQASLDACLSNAERMMDDALQLEFQERGGTRLAICMLAQEEYAKAFLLYMVREELIPWDSDLLRVIRNHACKHLIAIVMEYIDPEWETLDELRAIIDAEYDLKGPFPPRVSSALNILYHEKIRGGEFFGNNDYERDVIAIARGARDKVKQNSVYTDIDKTCRVKNSPIGVTREAAQLEYERARRYASIVERVIGGNTHERLELQKLKEVTKIVFWQKYKPIKWDMES
jgi:AbiV family abortive infection protein